MNPFEQMGIGTARPQQQAGGQSVGSILGQITQGATVQGARIVIGGVEKMGKTTLACSSSRPLLVQLEMGGAAMTVPKTPILTDFAQVMGLLREIRSEAQAGRCQFRTLVFDTGTALERLIDMAAIAADPASQTKKMTLETAHGGYGKGYGFANNLFADFTNLCDELAMYGGINIIVTCHVFASKVIDPVHGEFDQWDLLLHSPKNARTYGKREMITQWADLVGFLYEPVFISKGDGEQLAKATSLGRGRVLGVTRTPGYVAGNRYGIVGEIPIPDPNVVAGPQGCGWNHVAHAIFNARGIDLYNRDAF